MTGKVLQATIALLLLLLPLSAPNGNAAGVTTEIISVSSDGTPYANYDRHSIVRAEISNNGRFVAFGSNGKLTNDDILDTSPFRAADIFLRDRVSGTTTLLTPPGFYGGESSYPFLTCAISGDGNYVATWARRYETTGAAVDGLLLIDRLSGAVEIVKEGLYDFLIRPGYFTVDYDGDIFYFDNYNVNTNGIKLYKYDRQAKVSTLLYSSNAKSGASHRLSVNDDGTKVCFTESSGSDSMLNVYLLDVSTGNKTLVSVAADGSPAGASPNAKLSKNGDYVVFHSSASNIGSIPYPTFIWNLFLYDVQRQTIEKVNFTDPQYGYLYPTQHLYNQAIADVSNDGRYVVAPLTSSDSKYHVYGAVLDRQSGVVSFLPDGTPKDNMLLPVITPDGRYVVSNVDFVLLYDLFGGEQAFVVDAGEDQVLEQDSTSGAYATLQGQLVEGACSDGIFRWSWADGATIGDNPTVQIPAGTTAVTLDWSGCGETATDALNVAVQDTIAPTVDVSFSGVTGQNGWYRSDLTANLSAYDSGSGVREIRYRLDGGANQIDSGMSAALAVAAEGVHTLDFSVVDNAGNAGFQQNVSFQIDTIAPRTDSILAGQVNKTGLFVSEVGINLSAVDATSGVQQLAYRINGASWQIVAGTTTSLLLPEDGNYQIDFHAVDVAGNIETPQSISLSIDKKQLAPTLIEGIRDIVATIPPGAFVGNNPNFASKLTMEIDKILDRLANIDDSLTPAEKILEYEWAKKMLEDKLLAEFNRMINDPVVIQPIAVEIAKATAAIDVQIAQLRAQL